MFPRITRQLVPPREARRSYSTRWRVMLPSRFYPVFLVCFESALSIILIDFDGVKQRFLQGQKNEMEKDEIKDKLDILV